MTSLNTIVAFSFAAVTLVTSTAASAQANIVESQGAVVSVDAIAGSDVNIGTGQPLRTLQTAINKAVANSSQGFATRILIGPGDYREVLNFTDGSSEATAPITLEALQAGTVTVSGSDILTHFYQSSSNRSIYSYAWNHNFGLCPVPSGWPRGIKTIVRRREMIFVNGKSLTQELSASAMHAGTFFVDESANSIHIWPPSGTNMSSARVEASVRSSTLNVSGRSNIVFRGIVFQHASTCINQNGANVNGSSNVLFDNVLVQWNSWGGLGINNSNKITVKNSLAIHNGGVGFEGFHDRNAVFSNNESSYNNWRGAMGGLYDWGMGGLKLLGLHTGTITQFRAVGNQAQGLWLDTDNKNVTITGAHLLGNKVANLQLEANPGPIAVNYSSMCSGELGVNIIDTERLTATGNTFYGNGGTSGKGAQLFIAGNPGGRHQTDWETHQQYVLHTSSTTLRNNVMQDSGSGQNVFKTYLSSSDFSHFTSSFNASGNHWYDSSSTNKFILVSGRATNLKGWQAAVRDDYSSNWGYSSSAAGACH